MNGRVVDGLPCRLARVDPDVEPGDLGMPFQNRRPSPFQQALNRVALRLAELEIVTNVAAGDCQEVTPCDGKRSHIHARNSCVANP